MREPAVLIAACLVCAIICNAQIGQHSPALDPTLVAAVTVESEEPLRTPTLRENARINTNRTYRFRGVPDWLDGLTYTAHQHKNPASYICTVSERGLLYLMVGEGATVEAARKGPRWTQVGQLRGTDASAIREWLVYRAEVVKGASFKIESPNKWGAVLVAGDIALSKGVVLDTRTREYRFLEGLLTSRPDQARRERLERECAHRQAYGSLVHIDHRLPDDNSMSQVKRITPSTPFAESERGPLRYGTPWPLSESYYLCVFDWDGIQYGIYLVDIFGNHELIWEDVEAPCLDPMPLQSRPRPPVMPAMVADTAVVDVPSTGRVSVVNVYEADFDWPEGTRIEALRIVQVFPKSTPHTNQPNIGAGNQSLARGVIGTVPVEADGSAYFTMPAKVPVYFQALDAKGQAVQGMRSDTYVQPGELLSCLGCHEHKRTAGPVARARMPSALKRTPSTPRPEIADAYPLTFPRLVQPVLDRHCVSCHSTAKKAPELDGADCGRYGWSKGFNVLRQFAYARHGGNGAIKRNQGSRSIAGATGAKASRLLNMLESGHHGVELPPKDLRRISLWLDCNSNFYGAYIETEKQAAGAVVMPRLQ